MANIQELLNNIKKAVYGKDVRVSIHDAIKQCYEDAIKSGNANMEVIQARRNHSDLNSRLDSDKENLQKEINSLASGGPKGIYKTTRELISANPETGVYVISDNGHIYSWTKDGTNVIDLGVYQAIEYEGDKSTDFFGYYNNKVTERMQKLEEMVVNNSRKCQFEFEQGAIDTSGKELNINTEIRTKKIYDFIQDADIIIPAGFKLRVVRYDKLSGNFVSTAQWYQGHVLLTHRYNYRLTLAKTASENITISDGEGLYTNLNFINKEIEAAQNFDGVNYDNLYKALNIGVNNKILNVSKTLNKNYLYDISNISLYEQGDLSYDDGTELDGSTHTTRRIRSKNFIDSNVTKIVVDNDYSFRVVKYHPDGLFMSADNIYYKECLLNSNNNNNIKYKLVLRRDDEADFESVNEALNIHLYYKNFECKQWYQKNVSFMGDSITAGVNTERPFAWILNDFIKFSKVNNYGTNGRCVATYNLSGDVREIAMCNYVKQIDPDSDLIFFFGGTNDFNKGCPLGEYYSADKNGNRTLNTNTDTFIGALNVAFDYLQTHFSNKQIIILTPIHRSTFDTQPTDLQPNKINLYLEDYVEAVKKVAEIHSLIVVDAYKESGLNPNISENALLYFHENDKLHPNKLGHIQLAKLIYGKLKNLYPNDYSIY